MGLHCPWKKVSTSVVELIEWDGWGTLQVVLLLMVKLLGNLAVSERDVI